MVFQLHIKDWVKLEDEETFKIHYTMASCAFLNVKTCRCSDYPYRARNQPQCVVLDRQNFDGFSAMPFTCRYRLVHENRQTALTDEELRVTGGVVSEEYIHERQLPDHLVDWISTDSE